MTFFGIGLTAYIQSQGVVQDRFDRFNVAVIKIHIDRFWAAQAIGCPIKNLGAGIDQDGYLNEEMEGGGRLVLTVQINKEALVMFPGALSFIKNSRDRTFTLGADDALIDQ